MDVGRFHGKTLAVNPSSAGVVVNGGVGVMLGCLPVRLNRSPGVAEGWHGFLWDMW